MKNIMLILIAAIGVSSIAIAKNSEKQTLISNMTRACRADLAKAPALKDFSDGEKIWRNLEDKEHSGQLTKACHNAHEKYEHKYHRDSDDD